MLLSKCLAIVDIVSSLTDVPPVGLKYAYCWESSPTAGDAQCTYNCVSVTAANGTTFYPVVCRFEIPSCADQSSPPFLGL